MHGGNISKLWMTVKIEIVLAFEWRSNFFEACLQHLQILCLELLNFNFLSELRAYYPYKERKSKNFASAAKKLLLPLNQSGWIILFYQHLLHDPQWEKMFMTNYLVVFRFKDWGTKHPFSKDLHKSVFFLLIFKLKLY